MKAQKGFTLLELIVVVVIIGILASLAVANFIRVAERARAAEGKHVLGEIRNASMRWHALDANSGWPAAYADLDVSFPGFRFFAEPTLAWGAAGAGTASTVRSDGSYTLSINAAGNLTCAETVAGKCVEAGCVAGGNCPN